MNKLLRLSILAALLAMATTAEATTYYYVSPTGNDSNPGTEEAPFRTIARGVTVAVAGDFIFVRGGTYDHTGTLSINKSGTAAARYHLFAYPGETPIINYTGSPSVDNRGIRLNGSYWHVKGITIQNFSHNGVRVDGHHNILELMVTRYNGNTGLHLAGPASNNLVWNSDSYENYDAVTHGNNADGFGAKFGVGSGNVFRGCRAWGNSDDGFDFWQAGGSVLLENSWAYSNGFNIWGDQNFQGGGNGFKLGEELGAHVVIRSVAWGNANNGFDYNRNSEGITVYNSTAYNNGHRNFRFDDDRGTPHVLRNNIGYIGAIAVHPNIDATHNTWNPGFSVSASDFLSLDDSVERGPRQADGSLPESNFLRLAPGSPLINAGTDVGLAYNGSAPDLGAFESDYGGAEHIISAQSGNWNSSSTWQGGTVPGPNDDVIIWEAHTVTINVTNAATRYLVVHGALRYADASGNHLTVNGDLSITGGGALTASTVGSGTLNTLTVHKNLTNEGILELRGGSNRAVNLVFFGENNSIAVFGTYQANHVLNGVRINKQGGARVILGSNAVQHQGSATNRPFLHLQDGILETGPHSFIILGTGSESEVMLGGSENSYVIGSLGRALRTSAGNSTRSFPVGDEGGFRPFEFRTVFATGDAAPAVGHYLAVRVVEEDADNGGSTLHGDLQKVSGVRYYQLNWRQEFSVKSVPLPANRLRPTYGTDDGVTEGNNDLRVATSEDDRASWTSRGGEDHTTDLSEPPTQINADADGDGAVVTIPDAGTVFVALATTNTGTNPLTSAPLPVQLLAFTGTVVGSDVVLNWTVGSERNNAGFGVEQMVDGRFRVVGNVEGRGTASSPADYSYRVAGVESGRQMFRLQQRDHDGTVTYSNTVEVDVALPAEFVLTAPYPNPFNPRATFQFAVQHSQPVEVHLFDALGRRVALLYEGTPAANELETVHIDGSSLTSGTYFVRMTAGSHTTVRQVVLLK